MDEVKTAREWALQAASSGQRPMVLFGGASPVEASLLRIGDAMTAIALAVTDPVPAGKTVTPRQSGGMAAALGDGTSRMCACGHPSRDHDGFDDGQCLQQDSAGGECGCKRFRHATTGISIQDTIEARAEVIGTTHMILLVKKDGKPQGVECVACGWRREYPQYLGEAAQQIWVQAAQGVHAAAVGISEILREPPEPSGFTKEDIARAWAEGREAQKRYNASGQLDDPLKPYRKSGDYE